MLLIWWRNNNKRFLKMWEKTLGSWSLFIRVIGVTVIYIEGEIRLPRGVRASDWQKHTFQQKSFAFTNWLLTKTTQDRSKFICADKSCLCFSCFFKLLCHSNRLSVNELKYVNLLSFYSRSLKFGSRHRGPFKRTPSCNAYNWVFYWNRKGTHVTASRLKRICMAETSATCYHCGGFIHDRQCVANVPNIKCFEISL